MRPPFWLCIALLLGVTLSGCAEPNSHKAAQATIAPAPEPVVSSDTGSLVGNVLDDEQRPLVGAHVVAEGPSAGEALSDGLGRFTINGLGPGSYVVTALRLGYDSIAKRVEIQVGATTEVALILARIPVDEAPRTDYRQYDRILRGPNLYSFFLIAYNPQKIIVNVTSGAQEVVASLEWQANAPTTSRYMRVGLRYPDVKDPSDRNSSWGASPLTTRINEFELKQEKETVALDWNIWFGCSYNVSCLTDPDVLIPVVAYQQRVKLYSTVFYNQAAPPEYTGLP